MNKAIKNVAEDEINSLENIAKKCIEALVRGNKLLFCGNGGSAELCNHIAAELVVKYKNKRRALNAISLCSNISVITAIANDFGFEQVFSRQIEANGVKGDILFCISTSGKSKNVLLASETAKKQGITTIAMTGNFKCALNQSSNFTLTVDEISTPRVQEAQLKLGHDLVELIENGI